MKKNILLFIIFFVSLINCCSQVIVNEIMYAPSDATNEWFEVYNASNVSVNLQNWKWKDATSVIRTITNQNFDLPEGGYIIICEDSVKLKNQFPISGKIIQTLWNTLNNSGDNIILIDPANGRSDSVSYQPFWGGNTGGFSLERVNSSGPSNNSSNWGTSINSLQGTPGKQNSISPKSYDVAIKSFVISPLFPSEGEALELNFVLKNIGLNSAEIFSLNIFRDINLNSIPENNELIKSESFRSLNQADSILYSYSIQNIDTGVKQYVARIIYSNDNDTSNNELIRRVYVSSKSEGRGGMVINEIMYDPLSNQSEWIEFYNASGGEINIKGWKYKKALSSIILSTSELFIHPGDYFILAHDTSLYTTFNYLKNPEPNQIIKFSTSLSLNNTGENISLTDSLNNTADAATYDPNWNNPELLNTKGISLERINPGLLTNDKNNWSSSANISGGTPGRVNSIYTKNTSTGSTVTISPNPFSPDGDGYEDFTLIKYSLNVSFAQMLVKIYDIKGRQVRTLANNQVTGSEGTIIFNGLDNENQKLRIGIYILVIEAIDDRGGTVNTIKTPVVIAGKL